MAERPLPPCRYGGPGAKPICNSYCGQQTGLIWSEISDEIGWPERNALYEQRCRDELEEMPHG